MLSYSDRGLRSHTGGQCILLCPPTAMLSSHSASSHYSTVHFSNSKHISISHPQVLKVKKCRKIAKSFVALEGGIFRQFFNSSDCYFKTNLNAIQILMPYSFLLSAPECLLPLYKGCFLNNNPGSIICHFHQVPALRSYTF